MDIGMNPLASSACIVLVLFATVWLSYHYHLSARKNKVSRQ